MNHKLKQLKKFQNQIGGKGTMRRTVRKKKPLQKTQRMTIQKKNNIIQLLNKLIIIMIKLEKTEI